MNICEFIREYVKTDEGRKSARELAWFMAVERTQHDPSYHLDYEEWLALWNKFNKPAIINTLEEP
jgi:hypothetical protein